MSEIKQAFIDSYSAWVATAEIVKNSEYAPLDEQIAAREQRENAWQAYMRARAAWDVECKRMKYADLFDDVLTKPLRGEIEH